MKKILIRAILQYLSKKKKEDIARAAVKEMVEGPGTVNERLAQNRFICFKEGDIRLEK